MLVNLNIVGLNVVNLSEGNLRKKSLKYEWQSELVNCPEFKRVYVDNVNNILYGIRVDDTIVAPAIPADIAKDIMLLERKNK